MIIKSHADLYLMKNKKTPNETIKELKISLREAQKTIYALSNPLILGHAKNQSKTLVFGVNYQNFASDCLVLLE